MPSTPPMAPSPRMHMNPPTPHRIQNRPMLKTELLRARLQLAPIPSTLMGRTEMLPTPMLLAHLIPAPVIFAELAPSRHPPLVAADVDALMIRAVASPEPLLLAPVHLAVVPAAERRHHPVLPRVAEHGAVRRPAPPVPVAEPLRVPRLPAAGDAALAALVSATLNLLAIFGKAPVVRAISEVLAFEIGAPLLTLVCAAEV
ncbi:unnamed protein product [Clonostachys rosea]|uniref:Uncharacterized protein n=1 Tax=Bionectria ochroleuca TaxID=29856 RepID=A0ABY6UUU3_BIOOC|nr:unnamed protein product [Clonostachys rosea]